jgi:hypothetical protein
MEENNAWTVICISLLSHVNRKKSCGKGTVIIGYY